MSVGVVRADRYDLYCRCEDTVITDLCIREDLINDIHTVGDHTKCGVVAVKLGGILGNDEELIVSRIVAITVPHRDHTALMLYLILNAVSRELALYTQRVVAGIITLFSY